MATTLFTQNIVACIWDFDKTLIPEYMQSPLFRRFGIVEPDFWQETNALIEAYRRRGYHVSSENAYLNHLLTYVQHERMPGLNNRVLRPAGATFVFTRAAGVFPAHPGMGARAAGVLEARHHARALHREHRHRRNDPRQRDRAARRRALGLRVHREPAATGFCRPEELAIEAEAEIAQLASVIDNTTKTRALFEINKGTNKNAAIDVNANIAPEDRRIPFQNMIYIADGPSDIPSFSVVKKNGGKAYAVYNPDVPAEFEQNDRLRQVGRIDHYGPATTRRPARRALAQDAHPGDLPTHCHRPRVRRGAKGSRPPATSATSRK